MRFENCFSSERSPSLRLYAKYALSIVSGSCFSSERSPSLRLQRSTRAIRGHKLLLFREKPFVEAWCAPGRGGKPTRRLLLFREKPFVEAVPLMRPPRTTSLDCFSSERSPSLRRKGRLALPGPGGEIASLPREALR